MVASVKEKCPHYVSTLKLIGDGRYQCGCGVIFTSDPVTLESILGHIRFEAGKRSRPPDGYQRVREILSRTLHDLRQLPSV